jgi:GNAT superfamily N-acetyltransferase
MGRLFRPARAEDAQALAGLAEELGYPTPVGDLAARLASLTARSDDLVLVAEVDGEVLGWVHARETLSLASAPCALVTGLVVTTRARRMGLGRTLLEHVEGWARARGLGAVRLRSRVQRHDAHAFYLRLGYVETKRQIQFRKPL